MVDLSIFKNKRIGILGLGLTGQSALESCLNNSIDVCVWDDNQIVRKELDARIKMTHYKMTHYKMTHYKMTHYDEWINIDYILISPGVPISYPHAHPIVSRSQKIGAKLIGDIEILYKTYSDSIFIAITGTNGKSTTTALLGHILKESGLDAQVGGNIGIPVISLNRHDIYVLEISSYQLELLDEFKANIAILLHVTPDHCDRYKDFSSYLETKTRIFNNQDENDYVIISTDSNSYNNIRNFTKLANTPILISSEDNICDQEPEFLRGKHNKENISAAFNAARIFDISIEDIISSIKKFKGLKHRMQYIGQIGGVKYINDSKATNVESATKSLCCFKNIHWIVGGKYKGDDLKPLEEFFPNIIKAYLIGESENIFSDFFENKIIYEKCSNLEGAFKKASYSADNNSVILLSPACSSVDQWKNFEERGDAFIQMFLTKEIIT